MIIEWWCYYGVNYFSDEQVKELEKNPYVKKVSAKSITYSEEFKELFWIGLQQGMTPGNIFRKYGFDPRMLGSIRTNSFTYRVKKEAAREERFKDTRSTNSGRPPTKNLTVEEQLERLKQKYKILQQENDFLKRVRFINRKQISKLQKDKQ